MHSLTDSQKTSQQMKYGMIHRCTDVLSVVLNVIRYYWCNEFQQQSFK